MNWKRNKKNQLKDINVLSVRIIMKLMKGKRNVIILNVFKRGIELSDRDKLMKEYERVRELDKKYNPKETEQVNLDYIEVKDCKRCVHVKSEANPDYFGGCEFCFRRNDLSDFYTEEELN